MLIFKVCFILYFLNLSGKNGFWNATTINIVGRQFVIKSCWSNRNQLYKGLSEL